MRFSLTGFFSIFSAITLLIFIICVCLILFQKVGVIDMDKQSVHIINELIAEETGVSLKEIQDIEGFDEIAPEDLEYPYDNAEGC